MALMHCLHVLLYTVDVLLGKIQRHQIAVLVIRLPLTRIIIFSLVLERLHRPHRLNLLIKLLRRLLIIKETTVFFNEFVRVHVLIEAGTT